MDIIIKLSRRERAPCTHRLIETLGRFDETPDSLVIDLTLHGYVALGSKEQAGEAEAKAKILDALEGGKALTYDELAEETELPLTTVKRVVKRAVEEGDLHQTGGKDGLGRKGVKGHPLLFQTNPPDTLEMAE